VTTRQSGRYSFRFVLPLACFFPSMTEIALTSINRQHIGSQSEHAIECRRVWKIFGRRTPSELDLRQWAELSKQEIANRFDCIIGVADVSFAVKRGEIFCIMGLSGSGKSTLVRHINRLIDPTSGEILVNGARVDLMGASQLRKLRNRTVGMVFQHVALLPHRTVRDNVAFALELRGNDSRDKGAIADAKLDLVQLTGWGDRYPDELSGGMQQRVGLARALAADSDILLMDEPFSALDPLIRRRLQDQFLALSREVRKTTMFITHDLEEAIKLGDRIAIMRDGSFIQVGTPEEIVSAPADDYVADFVRGISRLKIFCAEHIMQPLSSSNWSECSTAEGPLRSAHPTTRLETLVELMIQSPRAILIEAERDQPVGIVTLSSLLRAIKGSAAPAEIDAATGGSRLKPKTSFQRSDD
jgi:glycine betaine/proline transport system ATP-binding protein